MIPNLAAVQDEAAFLKKTMRRYGLAEELGQAIAAMGKLVRDHHHFGVLLSEATPEIRGALYEALRPHLRFQPKPLDAYISEQGELAERKQLPLLDARGRLLPFRPARDVSTAVKEAENAIAESLAKRKLTLVCAKCAREDVFYAVGEETPVAVVMKARAAGWVYDYLANPAREICPDCPTLLRQEGAS